MIPLTPANIAFIAKTGSLQVASAGWQVFGWALVAVTVLAFGAVLVRLVLPWGRTPLIAPAPDSHGCPWCDDRYCPDSGLCNCTASCGRMSCMAGRLTLIARARAEDRTEAEADAMAAKWNDKQGGGRG